MTAFLRSQSLTQRNDLDTEAELVLPAYQHSPALELQDVLSTYPLLTLLIL